MKKIGHALASLTIILSFLATPVMAQESVIALKTLNVSGPLTKTGTVVTKHSSSSSSSSSSAERGRRGKRGHRGKKGKRGHHGIQGNKGSQGAAAGSSIVPGGTTNTAFISAVTNGFNQGTGGVIPIGTDILSFQTITNSGITLASNGVFTSLAGPGFYEVTYGANWVAGDNAQLVLKVDGAELTALGRVGGTPQAPACWAVETIVVHSTASQPTFEVADAIAAVAAMTLSGNGSQATAFVRIKKIN